MHLVFFLVLAAWICDDCVMMIVTMMTVDWEVLVGEEFFDVEVKVFLEEWEGKEIVVRFPEEVAVVYFLEFSCVRLGWVVLKIFLFPVSGHELRGSSS